MHTDNHDLPDGELIEHAKAGSQPAITELLRRYQYIVARSAARAMEAWKAHCDIDDLMQEGAEALLDAIRTFDSKQSKTLKPYAEKAIRLRILDYVLNRGETIRISRRALGVIAAIESSKQSLGKALDRSPSFEEIVRDTGLSVEAIREAEKWQAMLLIASLDQSANDDETQTIEESVVDETALTPEQTADSRERIELAHYLLHAVNKQERVVLAMSFGIGCQKRSYSQIGSLLGISKQAIKKIHDKGLDSLRERYANVEHAYHESWKTHGDEAIVRLLEVLRTSKRTRHR